MDDSTLDDVARRIVASAVEEAIRSLRAEIEQQFEAFRSDPLSFIRYQPHLLSAAEAAELVGCNPKTIGHYTRLPTEHPDYLPRVGDAPIRIVPADLADWVSRRRTK